LIRRTRKVDQREEVDGSIAEISDRPLLKENEHWIYVFIFYLTLVVTPAHSKSILGYDLFLYRLSHRRKSVIWTVPGETLHRERGGLTTTCGCLFGFVRKKTAHAREINGEKSSQRARAPFFFVDGGPMR
jgi:hypothetical protein